MSKESRRDNKRLSRIIKVDFGKEVGISLDELETEFDDLINELEFQVGWMKHKQLTVINKLVIIRICKLLNPSSHYVIRLYSKIKNEVSK